MWVGNGVSVDRGVSVGGRTSVIVGGPAAPDCGQGEHNSSEHCARHSVPKSVPNGLPWAVSDSSLDPVLFQSVNRWSDRGVIELPDLVSPCCAVVPGVCNTIAGRRWPVRC